MPSSSDFVANCTMLYAHEPPLDRAKAAVADGYRKLEFWWPFDSTVPGDREVDRFVDSVKSSGGQVIAMNFTLGGGDDGGRGMASHPARSAEFAEHTEVLAGVVEQLGIRRCNVPFGVRQAGCTDDEHLRTAVVNLVLASDRLLEVGAVPMLEPISGATDYPIVTAAQAVDVIEHVEAAAGRDGAVGLLADLYHFAANGEDVAAVLRRHVNRIVHVQVADFPGRHEPGTGTLDIDCYLKLLDVWGYRGEVAMEYIPSGPSPASRHVL
ncbi:TIM barrel protein [Mycobacterium sp. URHB0044]|uniref:TIM barrel protein n=1 Tax=Mycobacterium sp. URHB0044 TaxID=1380386 RepID=UPI00048FF285|nr:TIM barrel protein [Mycobacterium sp. URHB0044]